MFNNGVSRGGPAQQVQAPPALASQAAMVDVTIDLAVPLSSPRGAIGTLEIRQATYGDWIDCGPIQRNLAINPRDPTEMQIEVVEDRDAVMRWMCRLTGQPEAVLRTMGPRDALAVRREISRIVAEFEQGNSTGGPASSPSDAT